MLFLVYLFFSTLGYSPISTVLTTKLQKEGVSKESIVKLGFYMLFINIAIAMLYGYWIKKDY